MPNLSRRKWLKTAALTTTLFAGASSASAKAFDPLPEKWDETFDVVVIGSGLPVLPPLLKLGWPALRSAYWRRCASSGAIPSSTAASWAFRERPCRKKKAWKTRQNSWPKT